MLRHRQPAIFLDKDGTLIENVPYNVDCAKIRLAPRAGEALRRWRDAGFVIVVVTNQSGVALGYFNEHAVRRVELKLRQMLADEGVPLAGFYYCPHHPHGIVQPYACACSCRKPQPGLLLQAAHDLHLDVRRSWLIGDILDDIEAGHRAGCRTILIDNGGETEWDQAPPRDPDAVVSDLYLAARYIEAELSHATA